MADRDRKDQNEKSGAPRGGSPRRTGFGDDQGTRVGSPDANESKKAGGSKGPSSRTTSEGLEGAIMEDEEETRSTGAGAEAARGAHAFGSGRRGGSAKEPSDENLPSQETAGSEPLRGTHEQHLSGYGGKAGKPKESSDRREPLDYEGSGGGSER